MEQNFVALTEEELMNVDGGIAPINYWWCSYWLELIGGRSLRLLQFQQVRGIAAGYYANRP